MVQWEMVLVLWEQYRAVEARLEDPNWGWQMHTVDGSGSTESRLYEVPKRQSRIGNQGKKKKTPPRRRRKGFPNGTCPLANFRCSCSLDRSTNVKKARAVGGSKAVAPRAPANTVRHIPLAQHEWRMFPILSCRNASFLSSSPSLLHPPSTLFFPFAENFPSLPK